MKVSPDRAGASSRRARASLPAATSNREVELAASAARVQAIWADLQKRKNSYPNSSAWRAEEARNIKPVAATQQAPAERAPLVSDAFSRPSISASPIPSASTSLSLQAIKTRIAAWRTKNAVCLKAAAARSKGLETKRQKEADEAARRARLKPQPWSRLSDVDRLPHYSAAILSTGHAIAFTLNITPKLAERASKAEGGILDYLHRIVMRRLATALGASPAIVVGLELTADGRPTFTDLSRGLLIQRLCVTPEARGRKVGFSAR